MKTINKTIICAAAALALAGCTKEMETPADQELRKMSFTGVVDHNAGTKTALTSDYNVIWTSGDQISVFANGNNSQFTASNIRASESGLEGGAATFEGMATVADVYYGVYPYNESATISENVVSTVLPTDQTAVAGSFAVGSNISVARSAEDDVLQFRNAGAIVGLTVNGEGISAIRLQSADGTAAMSGAVTVDVSGDTPVMALASGAVDYIRLVAAQPSDSNPDATGTLTSGQTYYFVVAPGEYNGLKLVFENAGLDATYTTTTAEVVTVERNGNKNLGAFTVGEEDWIVNTYADYELNGKTEADAFVASVPEGEKLELRNLTVTGSDINNDVLASLASRISSVRGVMTFDGIGNDDPDTWLDISSQWYGRATSIMCLAVRARMLLFAASPLVNGNEWYIGYTNDDGQERFNTSYDPEKWTRAATACKELIDAAHNAGHALNKDYNTDGSLDPFMSCYNVYMKRGGNNPEILFVRPDGNYQSFDGHCAPRGASGNGGLGVTQTLVDAFYMKDGTSPITGYDGNYGSPVINQASGYSERGFSTAPDIRKTKFDLYRDCPGATVNEVRDDGATYNQVADAGTFNMYVDREPRFYLTVMWNRQWYHQAGRETLFLSGEEGFE